MQEFNEVLMYQPVTVAATPRGVSRAQLAVILVVAALIGGLIGLGGVYYFLIGDDPSMHAGVATRTVINLPHTPNRRYVEPISNDEMMVVTVDPREADKATGWRVDTSSYARPTNESTPPATPQSVDLSSDSLPSITVPSCSITVEQTNAPKARPYVVKDGEAACDEDDPTLVDAASLTGVSEEQKEVLGDLTVVGTVDGVTVVHSDPRYTPVFVMGLSKDNEVLWAKPFYGSKAFSVSLVGDTLWVTTDSSLVQLVPATPNHAREDHQRPDQAIPADVTSLPNYKAYDAYVRMLNEPDEPNFGLNRPGEFYIYGLPYVDDSDIPGFVLAKACCSDAVVPVFTGAVVYHYESDSDSLIRTEGMIFQGIGAEDRGFFYVRRSGPGLIERRFTPGLPSGPGPEKYTLYAAQDQTIAAVDSKEVPAGSEEPEWGREVDEMSKSRGDDLTLLREALGINVPLLDRSGQADAATDAGEGDSSSPAAESEGRTDAIKDVDFGNMTFHPVYNLTAEDEVNARCKQAESRIQVNPLQGGSCTTTLVNGSYTSADGKSGLSVSDTRYEDLNGDGYLDALIVYREVAPAQAPETHMPFVWLYDPDEPTVPKGFSFHHPLDVENLQVKPGVVEYDHPDFLDGHYHTTVTISGSPRDPRIDVNDTEPH